MKTVILMAFEDDTARMKFERIYLQYHRAVLERALTLLRNHHDAEDAAQETWYAVSKNLHLFSEEDPQTLKATILKIVKYKAIDLFRKRSLQDGMTVEQEAADYEMTVDDTVLSAICEKESVEKIVSCMRKMDERYIDILRLYYLQGNTTREIARLLSLNVKTVETRLARGRALLCQALTKQGFGKASR